MLKLQTGADNQVLREKSKPITQITKAHKKLVKDMEKTMIKQSGIGLAAPQVGVNIRLLVARLNSNTDNELSIHMINPEITTCSDEKVVAEEGCLSLPKQWGDVERSKEIHVRFQDIRGDSRSLRLEGLNARVIQHEIDHLEGVLFTDKATNIHEGKIDEAESI